MRHFYECPLKAGYMAKVYGMRFVSEHSGKEFDLSVVLSNAGSPIDSIREGQRYFVHPDSLGLLKPQIGDMLTNIGVTGWLLAAIRGEKLIFHDGFSECIGHAGEMDIIQRNGKHFFTPESTPE